MMPNKFLKIVKYIDQIAKLPDVTGDEIATIMIISKVLKNKTEQTTIDDVIKTVCDKVETRKLIGIYNRADELDLNFNQDLPAVQENVDPMPVVMGDSFENLPNEEKKRRVELLAEGLANTKEQEINLNKTIGALLDPSQLAALGTYPQEYHASLQLPFSRNTLSLKVIADGTIFYRFNEEMDWLIWDGSKHAISTIKTGSFAIFTLWQREEEMKVVNAFISTTYQGANFYFKNING